MGASAGGDGAQGVPEAAFPLVPGKAGATPRFCTRQADCIRTL